MHEIIAKTRTFRRFVEGERISRAVLEALIDLARLGGSARNAQPWQYMIVNTPERCAQVFPHLAWAGYLPEWPGPPPGERPSAYVLCLQNGKRLKGSREEAQFDLGIASQNLLLGATQYRLGGCRIGAFSPRLEALFQMPEWLRLSLVIALGRPRETVLVEQARGEEIRYWRDDSGIHHVPKRALADCLVELDWRAG